jgi:RNA polymerase sigma-70 factor (ECF subfamily)
MINESAIIAGDVWHELSEALRSFLRSRLPSESDADDLLQDVFVRVIEKIGSLREADRIESWVYQIARNAVADFYRRRVQPSGEPIEDAAAPYLDDVDGNHNHAIGTWLSAMIDSLPEKHRDAVRLYEVEGLSQAEIARRLNVSLSGAKSRVQRGRRQLEELQRGCCQLELDRRGNVIECRPVTSDCCSKPSCGCDDNTL